VPANWRSLGSKQLSIRDDQGQTIQSFPLIIQPLRPLPGSEGLSLPTVTPVLTGISPSSVESGKQTEVAISGSNIFPGATVFLNGTAADVMNTVVHRPSLMTFSLRAAIAPGAYSVTVRNAGVETQSNAVALSVQ